MKDNEIVDWYPTKKVTTRVIFRSKSARKPTRKVRGDHTTVVVDVYLTTKAKE